MDNVNIGLPRLYVNVVKANTPNYAELVRTGAPLPEQPYSLDIWRAGPGIVRTDIQYYNYGIPNGPLYLGTPRQDQMTDNTTDCNLIKAKLKARVDDVYDKRVNRLLSKIQGQSLSVGIMYRERRKTGELLTDFADKTVKTLKYWRRPSKVMQVWGFRGKRNLSPKFTRALRKRLARCPDLGSVFLQYRFAWTPLWKDIEASLDAAAKAESKLNQFRQAVGTPFKHEESYDLSSLLTQVGRVWHGAIEGYVGGRVYYSVSDVTLLSLGSLTNLAATAWDAVTWSFVIDRFINISQYLDLYDATIGNTFNNGSMTVFYKLSVSPPPKYYFYYPDRLTWNKVRYGEIYTNVNTCPPREEVYMRRTILSEFPSPSLEYPNFQWKHLPDYFFLVKQMMTKKKAVVAL